MPTESVVPMGATGQRAECLPKPCRSHSPNWSLPILAAIWKSSPRPSQVKRGIAGRTADAQFVVIDDDLGSGLRPWIGRAEDQIDIDVSDDGEWTHRSHSSRVILVERTGVPSSATRAPAKPT